MDEIEHSRASSPSPDDGSVWIRALYMVLFEIGFKVAGILLVGTAVLQVLWLAFAKKSNENVQRFGISLSKWLAAAALYLSCNTQDKPFPWMPWPAPD